MFVEDVEVHWDIDSKIDRTELGEESLKGEQLHSKYWKFFSRAKIDHRNAERELKKLRLAKWTFYTQGPSKKPTGTIRDAWKLPASGRVLKTEIEKYLAADEDLQEKEKEVERMKDAVDFLASILDTVKYRTNAVKNAIEWEKFTQGR